MRVFGQRLRMRRTRRRTWPRISLPAGVFPGRRRRIGWQDDIDVQNDIRSAMDDFLYDEIRGKRGAVALDTATMDAVMDSALAIARRQAAL